MTDRDREPWSMHALWGVAAVLGAAVIWFAAIGVLPGNPLFYAGTGAVLWGLWRMADGGGQRRTATGSALEAVGLLAATLGAIALFFAFWERFGGR